MPGQPHRAAKGAQGPLFLGKKCNNTPETALLTHGVCVWRGGGLADNGDAGLLRQAAAAGKGDESTVADHWHC